MCDMTEDDFEVPIKGVIVGNGAVGKSSMIQVRKMYIIFYFRKQF
jgi:GTPase SAR1 family protein